MGRSLSRIEEAGQRALKVPIEVRVVPQIRAGVQTVVETFGKVDILVSNAGINRPASGMEVTEEEWEDHFNINVKGGFFAAQAVAKHMVSQGRGRIIFISSQSGLVRIPGQPVYCSTKGALIQLTRTLGVEWAKHGITVYSIAPTFVETNMTRKRLQSLDFLGFVLGKMPCGRLRCTRRHGYDL